MTNAVGALNPYILAANTSPTRLYEKDGDGTREIKTIASACDATAKAIVNDQGLTEFGGDKKRGELASQASQQVDAWDAKYIQGLSTRIEVETARLRRQFKPDVKLDSAERLARELRHAEIRRGLAGVDPAMLGLAYVGLDEEIREAIREAPARCVVDDKGNLSFQPLVAPEVINDYDVAAMAEDFPEESAAIAELKDLRGTYVNFSRAIRGELTKISAPPSVEELAAAAEAGE